MRSEFDFIVVCDMIMTAFKDALERTTTPEEFSAALDSCLEGLTVKELLYCGMEIGGAGASVGKTDRVLAMCALTLKAIEVEDRLRNVH